MQLGVKIAGGTYEYVSHGLFLVTQSDTEKDKEMTTLTAFDQIIYSMIPYEPESFTYPTTVGAFYEAIGTVIGVPVETAVIPFASLTIDEDLYENIQGIQYRTILEDIAILGGQVLVINEAGQLSLRSVKTPTNTPDAFNYSHLKRLTIKDKYGKVNSLVLSRQPTEDNVVLRDTAVSVDITSIDTGTDVITTAGHTLVDGDQVRFTTTDILPAPLDIDTIYFVNVLAGSTTFAVYNNYADAIADTSRVNMTTTGTGTQTVTKLSDIEIDGLTEIKIINNEIIDKRREDLAETIFPYFKDTTYYPFTADTTGFGWFEVGDKLLITDDEAIEREVRIMGTRVQVDGSVRESIWSDEPTKTETNYARAGGLNNRIKNTEIIVDKQQQEITSVVSDLITLDGVVNANYSQIIQDLNAIIASVQESGGTNLIKNSVFFSYDLDGLPDFWTPIDVIGEATFFASPEAVSYGSISGHVVKLNDIGYEQIMAVVKGDPENEASQRYSFSCRVKKNTLGTASITLTDGVTTWDVVYTAGTSLLWQEVSFEAIVPENSNITLSINGDGDAGFEVTDLMLTVGKYKAQWTQANGEIMNTQVNIHSKGITVKSSVFVGDYTVISPLEFSGYANIGGVATKVFTLNKDVTEVKRLQVGDEITMLPIKVVPINNATNEGWAFVKDSGV